MSVAAVLPKHMTQPKYWRGILIRCVHVLYHVRHKDVQRAHRITKILNHTAPSSWLPPLFPGRAQVALIKLHYRPDGYLPGARIQ